MKKPRNYKRTELADWRQAARVEANLRREFHDKAEALELDKALLTHRIGWVQERHRKQLADYHFANGFRAGLECALCAIQEGRTIIGDSIDAMPSSDRKS